MCVVCGDSANLRLDALISLLLGAATSLVLLHKHRMSLGSAYEQRKNRAASMKASDHSVGC